MTPRQKLAATVRATIFSHLVRRPVTIEPAEGTLGVVDDGTVNRSGAHIAASQFRGGRWVRPGGSPLAFEPTFWMSFRDE